MRSAAIFGGAAVWIVGRRIVADTDELNALQPKNAPGLGPAAIVADHHPHDRIAPGRACAKRRKAQIAIIEVALFKLLETRAGTRRDRARQVHLAVATENFAVVVDQDRTVVAPAVRCPFGVADVEADAERAGAIEQRLHGRIRHAALVIAFERLALDQPSREERRERQFGKYHQACAARGSRFQKLQHASQGVLSRIRFLRRTHLSGGSTKNANQHCLQPVRIAA